MPVGMLGRKVGMMRLYDGGGRVRPVTAIELGPNRVTQIRNPDRDGYEAVQIGMRGNRKRVNRPQRGHLRAAQVDEPLNLLREFRTGDASAFELGQELSVERFTPGEFVDVTGTSKGRGFAGTVRRWNFRGGPKTHGQSDRHRAPGSIGAGTTPGKVWKGLKMSGHMGARRKTVRNLLVVQTDAARNLIFVEGSVPGPRNGFVSVQFARRAALKEYEPPAPFAAPEPEEPEPEEMAPEAAEAEAAESAVDETPDAPEAAETPEAAEASVAESGGAADIEDVSGEENNDEDEAKE